VASFDARKVAASEFLQRGESPMTRPNEKRLLDSETERQVRGTRAELRADDFAALNDPIIEGVGPALIESEKELLGELVQALRTIRYGSIVLTVHEGKLVEINKSIRIRRDRSSQKA
jgi:hypothetical protein